VNKVVATLKEAIMDIPNGATLAVGGFGVCGIPSALISTLEEVGTSDLEIFANNCGIDDWGLGLLLRSGRIRRMVASYVGENREMERRYLSGELELELSPQGTLAERMRAGGSGIPAFFTPAGVGTEVADGGLPWRYDRSGNVALASPPKHKQVFATSNGPKECVLEHALVADFGLVRAWRGDRYGNLMYRQAARNFNPVVAMCGRVTIAEVEQLVEPGELDPNTIHTPGIDVSRVVVLTEEQALAKRIERRTVVVRTAPAERV